MNAFRTRLSAAVVWGMIPLAVWAGLPSTACQCANGQLKLVCRHLSASGANHGQDIPHAGGKSSCCHAEADHTEADAAAARVDCCGDGPCGREATPAGSSGVASKRCCKPILTAPSVAPKLADSPFNHGSLVTAWVEVHVAPACRWLAFNAAGFDTGPPLDRVIVFRSLLI